MVLLADICAGLSLEIVAGMLLIAHVVKFCTEAHDLGEAHNLGETHNLGPLLLAFITCYKHPTSKDYMSFFIR